MPWTDGKPAEPGAEQDLLDGLLAAPATEIVRPAALSTAAIGRLAREVLRREPQAAFTAAARKSTGGNPLFVRELLRTASKHGLAGAAEDAAAVRRAAPDTVTRLVARRLRRLSAPARAVAGVVSVLGERSTAPSVGELAGLSREEALEGREALARAGLLENERLGFVHPIVREAVHSSQPAAEIRRWHRAAARMHERARQPCRNAPTRSSSSPAGGSSASRWPASTR